MPNLKYVHVEVDAMKTLEDDDTGFTFLASLLTEVLINSWPYGLQIRLPCVFSSFPL